MRDQLTADRVRQAVRRCRPPGTVNVVVDQRAGCSIRQSARAATILIDASMAARLDDDELAVVVAHEIEHWRRGDLGPRRLLAPLLLLAGPLLALAAWAALTLADRQPGAWMPAAALVALAVAVRALEALNRRGELACDRRRPPHRR